MREISKEYGALKFAVTLYNTADNLFQFLRYPGMPPTNNSDLDVCDWVVPQRNKHHKFMTQNDMMIFGILQSYTSPYHMLDLDLKYCLMKIFDDLF